MLEQLVEVLYRVFKFDEGGAADNSFKSRSTIEKAAGKVRRAYKGSQEISQVKCENKWADISYLPNTKRK